MDKLTPAQQRELLAELLRRRAQGVVATNTSPASTDDSANCFPMSAGQRGLWFAHRLMPTSAAYNVFLPSRVRTQLKPVAVQEALNQVVRRNASLRTTFAEEGNALVQRVHTRLDPEFQVTDLSNLREDRHLSALRDLLISQSQRPFCLRLGPLVRLFVCRLADDDWLTLATAHHIVVDYWSLVIILAEIQSIYPSVLRRTTPILPPAANNYREFVEYQQALVHGSDGKALQQFWKSYLDGCPHVLELPSDYVRPTHFTGRAGVVPIEFPEVLMERIAAAAGQWGTTVTAVLHAGVQVLMNRYTGQSDFVLGTPFVGRCRREFENTVGFFVNMLPVRCRPSPEITFRALCLSAAEHLMDVLDHQALPLAEIVAMVGPQRDTSRSPLIQVSCTFESSQQRRDANLAQLIFAQPTDAEMAGLTLENFYVPQQNCQRDLEFVFEVGATSLQGLLLFNSDLFMPETAQGMASNLMVVLQRLLAAPDRRIGDVRMKLAGDAAGESVQSQRAQGLGEVECATVLDLLAETTASAARQPALRYGDACWTYQELWDAVGIVAVGIEELSLRCAPDEGWSVETPWIVPVLGDNCPATLIGILAAMACGAAALPIDRRQPALSNDQVADVSACGMIDERWINEQITAPKREPVCWAVSPTELAYVVFTSGSTGVPNGVMIEHRSICNTLRWRRKATPLSADDRLLVMLSHQFDAGLGMQLIGLTQGAELVWPDPGVGWDTTLLIEQIIRDRITVFAAIPSVIMMLVEHPRFVHCTSLKSIWSGGEAMPRTLPQRLRQATSAELWNFYGPTEAAVEASACRVTLHDSRRGVPIGDPIDNVQMWILDEQLQPVLDTMPGQLAIAGAGLARGYLQDRALTEQRFRCLRLGSEQKLTRVYLTGDRARQLPDGSFEFLGRLDQQAKVNGYRIELEEIESAILNCSWVASAAVVVTGSLGEGRSNVPLAGGDSLFAFVTLRENLQIDASEVSRTLQNQLSQILPIYKVPHHIVVLDAIPMTPNGKVDRRQLRDRFASPVVSEVAVRTASPLTTYLLSCWQDALGVRVNSLTANLFELGGSSLQAVLLASRLSADLQVHLPTAWLFDLLNIEQLARRLVTAYPTEMAARFGSDGIQLHSRPQYLQVNAPETGADDVSSLIVPLKSSGSRTPIFMVHPPGGIVACYQPLAAELEQSQPMYAVRSHGLMGDHWLPRDLPTAAAAYLRAVQAIQPQGPYVLGGWSLGGIFAFEMAQQLFNAGEQVERLLLLDTAIPAGCCPDIPDHLLSNEGLEYGIALSLSDLVKLKPEQQLPFLWQHAKKLGLLDEHSSPDRVAVALEELRQLFHHHLMLASEYTVTAYPGKVTLFRPAWSPYAVSGPEDRGWRYVAKSVQVNWVDGQHHSMVQQPHVIRLAAAAEAVLAGTPESDG